MLPSNLLVARTRGYFIYPKYSHLTDTELYVARKLIQVFKESIGLKKKQLEEKAKEIENEAFKLGLDYRFARGLIHLLLKRTSFAKPATKIDPIKARLEIFTEASKLYSFTLNEGERAIVFKKVSERLKIPVEELIKAFKAVHEEEQVVEFFEEISPEELLKYYNLSLAQTLLFKALNIDAEIQATGTQAKIILFNVKRLGLMYTAEQVPQGIKLTIDGPASAVKQTERYGTRLAKLLPYIISLPRWRIYAKIKKQNRVYNFYLTDKYSSLFPKIELKLIEYDSDVEETFYKRFQTLGSGWKIIREPEPLVAGTSIFIPDFAFVKNGVKVYLEIVGFWTKDYLERKINKLRKLKEKNIILAVNEELSCSKVFAKEFENVIFYKRKLPAPEVYLILKKYEPRTPTKKKAVVKPSNKIILPEEAEEFLKKVQVAKLSTILNELKKYNLSSEEVVRILEEKGFEIIWSSIDPSDVTVRKKLRSLDSK